MFWVTETIPLAVTALIPVVLFPILEILDSRQVCYCYMNETIMVFIGGLILAIAIEHCNLHLRIALVVMKFVGCSHGRLLGGVCFVTTFMSLWISNTASCAMMIPIIFAILEELERVCDVFLLSLQRNVFFFIIYSTFCVTIQGWLWCCIS